MVDGDESEVSKTLESPGLEASGTTDAPEAEIDLRDLSDLPGPTLPGTHNRKKLSHRHEVIAWMAASGASQAQIAEELGYSQPGMSVIFGDVKFQARVKEIRTENWGNNIQKRFQNVLPRAMDVAEGMIEGTVPAKSGERWDAAKWLLEKVTGKPKQEYDIDGGATIRQILQALDAIKRGNEDQERRVEPLVAQKSATIEHDNLADWVSQHVPEPESEKSAPEDQIPAARQDQPEDPNA